MRLYFLFFLLYVQKATAQSGLPAVGMWREHLPYQGTLAVTASQKKVYAATEYSLFSLDRDSKEINRFSKISGLSETGISTVEYDPFSEKLWIAYANSNIDILDETGIHNVPDLKRAAVSGDKNIYHIFPANHLSYLSTGLGILVVDAVKYEIKESWIIGRNGGYVRTNGFTQAGGFYFAATEEGLKKTSVATSNPADFNAWETLSGFNGLSSAACKGVVTFDDKPVALQNDSLFIENGSLWIPFFSNGWPIVSVNTSENRLTVCQRKSNGEAQVVVILPGGTIYKTLRQEGVISFPEEAISLQDQYWVADLNGGLSHWIDQDPETYKLNSPDNISLGQSLVYNNIYYATAGAVNSAWNYQYNPNGLYKMKEGYWTSFNQYHFPTMDTLLDVLTLAVDPRDESLWAGSFGGGLLHLKDQDQLEIFKQNSPLEAAVGDPGSYRVSGLSFDRDHNLWISNFGSARQLHVLKPDGSWNSFSVPFQCECRQPDPDR